MNEDVKLALQVIGGGLVAAKTAEKVLGPTAEYLGQGIKGWAERRTQNVWKIIENAQKKLGDKAEEPGRVPPKVLKELLDEGSYCDDALAAEYFGGVLASSRSPVGRDDRGANLMKLVAGLSSYQIRAHYIFYTLIKRVHDGAAYEVNNASSAKAKIFIHARDFVKNMDFAEGEDVNLITSHIFFGLSSKGLIGTQSLIGKHDFIAANFPEAPGEGLVIQPTGLGTELFLRAMGSSDVDLYRFFSNSVAIDEVPDIKLAYDPEQRGREEDEERRFFVVDTF